jgi:hypothetical protein
MKAFCAGVLMLAICAPAQAPAGKQIVIHVKLEEFARAKDECDLANLLREDLENTGKGIVDLNLRSRINAIMRRLPKEQ